MPESLEQYVARCRDELDREIAMLRSRLDQLEAKRIHLDRMTQIILSKPPHVKGEDGGDLIQSRKRTALG